MGERSDSAQLWTYERSDESLSMTESDPAEPPPLNEGMPPLDAPVAVEWWFEFEEKGQPRLDTFHGFHDAEKIADGEPPAVTDGEIVTAAGVTVESDSDGKDNTEDSHHLFLTHREALERGIDPCTECFPAYATERRIERERGDDGILGELGVEGVVFALSTRHDLDSEWKIDSVHESYTSLLYRARAVRAHVGSAAGRLRVSYMPIRRAAYASFDEAMEAEPFMAHVSELRPILPEELSAVRDQVGNEVLQTQVEHEHRFSETGNTKPSVVHKADTPPCGYERESSPLWGEDDSELREMLDEERQTVADVIEGGNVVEFCASCFPELAAWTNDSEKAPRET